ncbi:unnamed protein product [Lampetra planeri]
MRKPPPTAKAVVDLPFIMHTLPDCTQSCIAMAITRHLKTHFHTGGCATRRCGVCDVWMREHRSSGVPNQAEQQETSLEQFPDDPFPTPEALKAIDEYQEELEVHRREEREAAAQVSLPEPS